MSSEYVKSPSPMDTAMTHTLNKLPGLLYWPEDGAIVIQNGAEWFNRPLYCNARYSLFKAGEMPSITGLTGTLYIAIRRNNSCLFLHQFASRTMRYRPGRMEWELSDPRLAGLTVILKGTTLTDACGFAACLAVIGAKPGDEAAWCIIPATSKNIDTQASGFGYEHVLGKFSSSVKQWELFAESDLKEKYASSPDIKGEGTVAWFSLVDGKQEYIAMVADEDDRYFKRPLDPATINDTAKAFEEGMARAEAVGQRVVVDTPDPYFNTGVAASCAAVDGIYVEPAFAHGGSLWRLLFSGWRVMGGATSYGWHDRVATALEYYDKYQIKQDDGKVEASPSVDGCEQAENSRFYGEGFIGYEGCGSRSLYNFQTQFMDECIRDWRATGDASFEKRLLPMLELHLQWCKDCFDPDDDGLYESFNNTWPSDTVWFNGGETPEQSAYVYYACRAAADMRKHMGDDTEAATHTAEADKILSSVNKKLWLEDKGQFASHLEQGGHERIHDAAWVYAQHVPIEAGMTTPEQTWRAMYYTEWAMERFLLPYGGEMRQTSNWVPAKWSVRELYPGDNFAMALGYFLGGQGDEGWQILRGTMLQSMYGDPEPKTGYSRPGGKGFNASNLKSPGGLSHPDCAIDFTDLSTMFCRAVVEGLFGYRPDYPNSVVRMAPAFPSEWPRASIRTPDFSLSYKRDENTDTYELGLTRKADVEFRLPIRANKVKRVCVDGQDVEWKIEPWAGCAMMTVYAKKVGQVNLTIELAERVSQLPCLEVESEEGQPGYHLQIREIKGEVPRYQMTKVHVADRLEAKSPVNRVPAKAEWKMIDMDASLNGDIRTIFKQDYRSPRPNTVSMRIGYDGYSAWTFKHWDIKPPEIQLDDPCNQVQTSAGAVFAAPGDGRNIAFTSLWDNWPNSVTVPVNTCGEAIWLLVCGSTNPMQCRIANAILRFRYADGQEETLELVPPFNFWSLCNYGGADYDYARDSFSMPKEPPAQVQLGENCRAMVYGWTLRPGIDLRDVILETLSQEVVIGLMGVSIMNPRLNTD